MTLSLPERPRELHDILNRRFYHPLARRLAKALVGTFVTPNMVSVIGGLFVVAATIVYLQPGWPLPAIIGLMLHMGWHIVDGADGDLARMTGTSSVRGELIDGICDYASHIFLYLSLGTVMATAIGGWGWVLLVIAGASHIIQVNHYEVQRRRYQFWVYDVPWMATVPPQFGAHSVMGLIKTGYLALAAKLGSQERSIEAHLQAARGDPKRLEAIRAIIKAAYKDPLKGSTLLGANHRTITLGVSMIAGSPLYHMVYQSVVLNLLLIRSLGIERRAVQSIITQLSQPTPGDRQQVS